jgi:hypothetical protein
MSDRVRQRRYFNAVALSVLLLGRRVIRRFGCFLQPTSVLALTVPNEARSVNVVPTL